MNNASKLLSELFDSFTKSFTREQKCEVIKNKFSTVDNFRKSFVLQSFLTGYLLLLQREYDFAEAVFLKLKQRKAAAEIGKYIDLALGFNFLNRAKNTHSIDEAKSAYENAKINFELGLKDNPLAYGYLGYGVCLYEEARTYKLLDPNYKQNQLFDACDEALKQLDIASNLHGNREFPVLLNKIGDVYQQRELYDKAEKYYKDAMAETNDEFAYPYNGLGKNYLKNREIPKAINEFQKAMLKKPDFVYPLAYLGDCFLIQGDYQKALSLYKNALRKIGLDIDEFDLIKIKDINSPHDTIHKWKAVIVSLYGIGRVYYELGKSEDPDKYYNLAQTYFNATKATASAFPYVYLHSGRLFLRKNDLISAVKEFETAKSYFENLAATDRIEETNNYLKKIETLKILDEKLKAFNENHIELFLLKETQNLEQKAFVNKKKNFFSFLSEAPTTQKNEGFIVEVLRRWNSYTPLVSSNNGGGYFICIEDEGLVVDPGYNFINNFRSVGHKFHEIDSIFISHSHDDHTADFEPLINLLFRYNKDLKDHFIPNWIARKNRISKDEAKLQCNKEIADNFDLRRKTIKLLLPREVKTKFEGIFELNNVLDNKGRIIDKKDENEFVSLKHKQVVNSSAITLQNGKTNLIPIRAFHETYPGKFDSHGFYITNNNVSLLYTGDTGWKYASYYSENVKEHLAKNKVMIAHFGGFEDKELKFITDKKKSFPYYKNHLGRLGMVQLVKSIQPQLCILSEFGEEFKGLRSKIARAYTNSFKESGYSSTKFIPGDLKLKIKLDSCGSDPLRVWGITYIDYITQTFATGWIEVESLNFTEIDGGESIIYFQSDLDASEVVDAIHKRYLGDPTFFL